MTPIQIIQEIATITALPANKVTQTLKLLKDDNCTVPFIARYRKEATGNLDEVQIRAIEEGFENINQRESRRTYILDTIEKMEMLTPALKKKIETATTLTLLEDLYAPFKSKKKTRAQIAKEFGLEPLAQTLLTATTKLKTDQWGQFIDGKNIKNEEEALKGALDILMEEFAHNIELKERLRTHYWSTAKMQASKRKDADKIPDAEKFKDFFEFSENLTSLKNPKSSHRFLAMRRGMTLKILKMEVESFDELGVKMIQAEHFPAKNLAYEEDLIKAAQKAYKNTIHSSLDLEIKTDLKKIADEAATEVFGQNLKNLLLSPYLGSKAVMGIDPGIRTGCKVVLINDTGKFIGDHVIYPFEPKNDLVGSKTILEKMIEMFKIEYIAIGNGTFGRETLAFVQEHVSAVKNGTVKATMVNESGASIYSASDIARKEFPDKDLTVRGAISIARRFQDPLAELVKLDPKSIGVGQYQHDVNQIRLKKSLHAVVESCVNFCGVDLNTASAPLLSYISGIGPTVAENIVKYREKNKGITERQELLSIPRFSQKVFEQSAGFLRIYESKHALDSTFIHPEQYPIIEDWCKANKIKLKDMVEDPKAIEALEQAQDLKTKIGEFTFKDITQALKTPAQDPRTKFKSVEFDKTLKNLKDLKVGSWYQGIVNNITMFGAFVDIGIKESGLLHVSQISDDFVENALDKLKVAQEVKVRILEVDADRKRISLSMKSVDKADGIGLSKGKSTPSGGSRKAPPPRDQKLKNNAFGGLKNFQIKK